MNTEAASVAPRSIWGIIGDVFFSPVQGLEDFKKKPTWVIPLILCLILMAIASGLPYKQNAQAQVDLLSTSSTLPPQVLESIKTAAQNPSPVSNIIGGVVAFGVISLIGALLAWMFGSFIFAQKVKYSHVLGVGLLTGLISVVGRLLSSILIIAKDSILVSLGPAALMPGKDFTSFVYSFLYFTDIFTIWGVIITGLGYAAIFGLSRGKGMTISIVVWLIGALAMVSLQHMGLSLAGVKTSFF